MFELIADWIVRAVPGVDPASRTAAILHFFIYDSLKILALLYGMIFAIGFLRTFLPHRKMERWLNRSGPAANVFASLFGAVTPFCSCSSIPIFFGFLRGGVPLGVAFSFLITSPLVNEYLVVLMAGFFGWKITGLYVASGMLIGVACGLALGRMNLEKHLVADFSAPERPDEPEDGPRGFRARLAFGWREAGDTVKKIWIWILAGIAVGALIHNVVPEETIRRAVGTAGFFSVPLAALLGVPLYGSCAAIVPVAVVLFQKGVPLGTALAFMMAVAALSLPEAIMLRRAMRLPLIAIFFGITTLGIIVIGYLFNLM